MNCLTCATPDGDTLAEETQAVASCARCGAGVCLAHSVTVIVPKRPVGLIPQDEDAGTRRVLCAGCATPKGSGIRAGRARGTAGRAR